MGNDFDAAHAPSVATISRFARGRRRHLPAPRAGTKSARHADEGTAHRDAIFLKWSTRRDGSRFMVSTSTSRPIGPAVAPPA